MAQTPLPKRYIVGVGKSDEHRIAVGIQDGRLVQFVLDGSPLQIVEWNDGKIQVTASLPEYGIEAITPETDRDIRIDEFVPLARLEPPVSHQS